jgi:hypothetical protein
MIFVSYSHADEKWRARFATMSKPLSRSENIKFWSDRDLKAGEWEPQLERAMQGAVAAVLLVSDNFLASDFICSKELPFLLRAYREDRLMIVWAFLEPCDVKRYPEILKLQAMTLGNLEPLSKMTDWRWKETMLRGCDMIDEFLKNLERPVINTAVRGRSFPRIAENVPLLAKPARRDVEVLVYAAPKWWRQRPIKKDTTEAKLYLGDGKTKSGTKFTVIAMTTDKPLSQQTYLNLPEHRTKSGEVTFIRS